MSISITNTTFENWLNIEKFPFGPIFDKPSPILLNVSMTDETVVVKSKSSSDRIQEKSHNSDCRL